MSGHASKNPITGRPPVYVICLLPRLLTIVLLLAGCSLTDEKEPVERETTYSFEDDAEGWSGGFSDFSVPQRASMSLTHERRRLPAGVDSTRYGLFLSGRNMSDDLFMFLKRRVEGLAPGTAYRVRVRMRIASASPSGCVGIGGPPGEAVYVKVGASTEEPIAETVDEDVRFSVDKGNQSNAGDRSVVVGNAANGVDQCTDTPFRMITRSTEDTDPLVAEAGAEGSLWVFVGTDSGFEGTTALYYDEITVTLEPVE